MISLQEFIARAKKVPFLDKGRDWSGWDCWGLVGQVYRLCCGLELPDERDRSYRNPEVALATLLVGARQYLIIPYGRERPLDVLLFRPCHAGVVVRRGWMVNAREGRGTLVERYDGLLWRSHLVEIRRHEQLDA
jgi:probable lipoprotein NlpC